MLLRSFEPPNLPFPASMLSIRMVSMLFPSCFEASNHSIFHSRPASKLRTTQSSIPGQYAIYTYCQYASYMLLRSFEPPNLPFPASMLSIRMVSMLFPCCFEASNHSIFHSRPASKLRTTQSSNPGQYAIYTYGQYASYMLLRSFEPPNLPFPASMLSIRMVSMLFPCCFEASNHSIFHSRPASKLRTTQSSNPGQYAIYTYGQYAIYMLL